MNKNRGHNISFLTFQEDEQMDSTETRTPLQK